MHWQQIAAAAAALVSVASAQAKSYPFPTSCTGAGNNRFQFTTDPEWKVTKLLGQGQQMRGPRSIVFDTAGNMLILQAGKGVSLHTFGADGCVASSKTIVNNARLNHGLSLTPDGKTLYASSETNAWSWSYDVATGATADMKVVLQGISRGIHSTRTVQVVPQKPNLLLAQVGSNANWDYATASTTSGRSMVKVFDMDKVPAGGYQYNTAGTQLGYGMRNVIGLTFDPAGHVWGVENSGDDFRRTVNGQSTDIHIDNPGEEMNYLGDPTVENKNWYGYPTCFATWNAQAIGTVKVGEQFVVSPNASFPDTSCAQQAVPPRLTLPAHSAPIANVFDKNGTNMYVTLHGSWDRQPAIGYKVIEVPFKRDNATGLFEPVAAADSTTSFKDIMFVANAGGCNSMSLTRSTCVRPAGLAWNPDYTNLYVTSDNDAEGEVWVLSKK